MDIQVYKDIKAYLKELIAGTEFENKVYTVGGCCRDEYLGNEINDIDIVIELPDGGIRLANWLYENKHTNGSVVTYPSYGTAMFKLDKFPDIEIEAVQTRSEKYVDRDSRNPSTEYGTIEQDCMRRDFTVNALYCNVTTDELLDICGHSFDDLKNHIICTPCDPDITFEDDPLRIMRCVRFASRYKWDIDGTTYEACQNNVERLNIVSAERITDEFNKMMSVSDYESRYNAVYRMKDIGIFDILFPDIHVQFNCLRSKIIKNRDVAICTLLYGIKPEIMKQVLVNMKYSNADINHMMDLHNLCLKWQLIDEMTPEIQREWQYDCKSEQMLNDVHDVVCSILQYKHTIMRKIDPNINHYDYKLPVNGDDIMKHLGIEPGPKVKEYLDVLIKESFKNPEQTKRACLKFIKQYHNEHKDV